MTDPLPAAVDPAIAEAVSAAWLVDTHEHLPDESVRTGWQPGTCIPCDDWGLLLTHYLNDDLRIAGMPEADVQLLGDAEASSEAKWRALEPWWPKTRHTAYAQVLRETLRTLYGIEELSAETIGPLAERYRELVRPGFYREVLRRVARIESCQVNDITGAIFHEAEDPLLLMQDIGIQWLHTDPASTAHESALGLEAPDLAGYHAVIDAAFARWGEFAVGVKCPAAYMRNLDYERVPADAVEGVYTRIRNGSPASPEEWKALQDHLFWWCVDRATEMGLPVKLHTGYLAGTGHMPMDRILAHPREIAELCRKSPETRFVFFHACWPHTEELLAVAKHWPGAHLDLCWAWILNPLAAQRLLMGALLSIPHTKLLPFGGDYMPVELVVGHAAIARRGIALSLSALVRDGWLAREEALALVEPICHGNAEALFDLPRKRLSLARARWRHVAREETSP